jgi:acetate kinase
VNVLVFNAGSSSHKAALYALEGGAATLPDTPPEPPWGAEIQWAHGKTGAELTVRRAGGGEPSRETLPASERRKDAIAHLLRTLWEGDGAPLGGPGDVHAVGHRVVHGGREYTDTVRIMPEVRDAIARLAVLAPVHNPPAVEGIDAAGAALGPDVPQFAVFDTAFHGDMPEAATVYGLPYALYERDGIQRYGFHGISHRYVARRAAALLGRPLEDLRLVTCHLGNGASLAAVQGGRSVDTTMGFTPLEGMIMGTRSGSVDPGAVLHLIQRLGHSPESLDALLNKESGLKGLSGVSGDLRDVLAAVAQGDARASLAFDAYVHSLRRHIGAMLAALGGLDALVFTAGVGENSPVVRAAACEPFAFAGVRLDHTRNEAPSAEDRDIAADGSPARVLVVRTQEDWAIARESARLLAERE